MSVHFTTVKRQPSLIKKVCQQERITFAVTVSILAFQGNLDLDLALRLYNDFKCHLKKKKKVFTDSTQWRKQGNVSLILLSNV